MVPTINQESNNMKNLIQCFEWMQKEIDIANSQLINDLSLHKILNLLSHLKLKINSAMQYARMEITKRELIRLGYNEKQIDKMSCL